MNSPARYGACITSGAQDWQVFQQTGGFSDIALAGTWTRHRLEFEPPLVFRPVAEGGVRVRARMVHEENGRVIAGWQDGDVRDDGSWQLTLCGIPAGGPYRLETDMHYDGCDGLSVTRGDTLHFLGVGDIFVIAGQSNAAGRAREPVYDPPSHQVRQVRANGQWGMATHPLADETSAVFVGHYANANPGHSPFIAFAKQLSRALGYPIGLVMTAYGGAPLRWWNPRENGALFDEMRSITEAYCPKVRGILWYQGEADAMELTGDTYLERFSEFVASARAAFSCPSLPFFTVQLGRITNSASAQLDLHWAYVREAQRKAAESLENVYVLPAIDLPLCDHVHLSAGGNLTLARRLADCALGELYGAPIAWRAPQVADAKACPDGRLLLTFSPIHAKLFLFYANADNLPFAMEDEEGLTSPVEYEENGTDQLFLTFARPAKPGNRLHGAWEGNPPGHVPADLDRQPMLAFYGMAIA